MGEYSQFHLYIREGLQAPVDLAWLSCFYMVIATAASGVTDSHPALLQFGLNARTLAQTCFDAAHTALEGARWSTRPQVRAIQSILLKMAYFRPGAPDAGCSFFVWTAAAIRLCQLLGLHKLGTDKTVMPPADPAWPAVPCALRRELAKRIWWWSVAQDWMFSTTGGGIECIQLGSCECVVNSLVMRLICLSVDTEMPCDVSMANSSLCRG